ncbi:MAG: apolipoprotein N-acyltransferase [Gammaproteobacteria bacterium]|nr:apolipoprotein N-acyltransferase [Gammaproteobacteria bacterium]MBQ0839492.1 apolipoprotein N-acyltransferase [Gammaproteobacteria bacterium]
MPKRKSSFSSYLLALFSGALLPLALAPFNWWPTALFSTCALCFLCRGQGMRGVFALSMVFGFGLYGVGASWIYVSIHDYGHASVGLASLLTGLFALGMALVFALPLSLFGLFRKAPPVAVLFAFPALWVLGEWFRGWFLTGFPWLNIGYGFIDTWLVGWAPIFGVLALSGIIAFSGALVSLIGERKQHKSLIGNALILLTLICAGGAYLKIKPWTYPSGKRLKVALVQPNLPLLEKWDDRELKQILVNFKQSNESLLDQDLIVWPESALPTLQSNISGFLDEIDTTLREEHVGLLTGIPSNTDSNHYYNSVLGLGRASGSYQKRRLVPFGEYVPLERWLRGAIGFFDLPMSAFSAGADQQRPIRLGTVQIATAICYEIAYPDLLARDARDANILLTVSNDTWFGQSIGPHQHLQIARMRAIENAKPLLRSTNDGISANISPRGKVLEKLPRFQAGILKTQVTPYTGSSPFSQYGSLPIVGLSFVILIVLRVFRRFR